MAQTKQPEKQDDKTSRRVVGTLSALYSVAGDDLVTGQPTRRVLSARRGEEIDLIPSEEKRLDELGALLPKGSKPEDAERHLQARVDEYRGQRGDQEALARHVERVSQARSGGGEIVNVDAPSDGSVSELAEWIRSSQPSSDDTVALAEGDPEKAQRVLEAEGIATGGSPRPDVQQRLSEITEGR